MKFKAGDKVRLLTGSGEMTVVSIFGGSLVECEWVGKENRVYKNSFRPDSLVLSEAPDPAPEEKITKREEKE